ncbi:hypothetical protein MPER_16194 [Moniliophthora perniciosa FA553]|nr:hypothetical protein MPER_16194 [Moniliophthora perniciosa FA553]
MLRRLRLIYNQDDPMVVDVLERQDFTNLASVTHLYLSYWCQWRDEIQESLLNILIGNAVEAVALESNAAIQMPIRLHDLYDWIISPKVVFVIKRLRFQESVERSSCKGAVRLARRLCLLIDAERIRDVSFWGVVDDKVRDRWVQEQWCTVDNRIIASGGKGVSLHSTQLFQHEL